MYDNDSVERTLTHFREVLVNIVKHANNPVSDYRYPLP